MIYVLWCIVLGAVSRFLCCLRLDRVGIVGLKWVRTGIARVLLFETFALIGYMPVGTWLSFTTTTMERKALKFLPFCRAPPKPLNHEWFFL